MAGSAPKAEVTTNNEIVLTPVGRLSFPVFQTPRAQVEGGTPKFGCALLFDEEAQDTKEFRRLQKAVEKAIQQKWGDNPPRKIKRPFLTIDDLTNVPDGYEEGHVFIRPSSTIQPGMVDPKNQDIIGDQITTKLYAGCYVRLGLHAYAWKHPTGGAGVSFGLDAVQFVKDGEPFQKRTKAQDVFDALEDDDDDDDDDDGI